MNALELHAVTYSYPAASEPALRDLTLEIAEGEFVVLAGGSAAGKSTLLGVASGLVPHFHGGRFDGRAEVCGMDLRSHGPAALAGEVGTLFQDPETQVVMGTVRAELAFPLENRGYEAVAVARGVEEVALALGIESLLERTTVDLSGGELQRVALGAALAGRPRLLVLDEPTSQLDPVAGDELLALLRRLNEEWGTTIMLAEHRLERCLAAADRVIALERGAVACDAAPSGFLEWAHRREPGLETPGAALIAGLGLGPPPAGVKQARATLRAAGLLPDVAAAPEPPGDHSRSPGGWRRHRAEGAPALQPTLRLRRVWHELAGGRAILADVSLSVRPGERVVLLGRNGAGKSTLLRHVGGLIEPTRGRVERSGRVALLLQNPGDYFVHDRVGDELDAEALREAGLEALADRHPRDCSGGERQRLALAIVTAGDPPAAVLCLDEPTRGMDRLAKRALADRLVERSGLGGAVVVATHDPEFAASFATRAVLLADGRIVADASPAELLSGGWYFATETARILGGHAGILTAVEAIARLGAGAGALESRA
ncbi:MAG TPA: ATP-binding cassette domain-containing protein [Solirubrobacteraceae bacterium]|nr:ATP-binding cassette domain-containing protein [Solirubrobacteraceae bacterium]